MLAARTRKPFPDPQPAKAALTMRRLTQREVAIRLGLSELVVGRYLNGWDQPSPRFRAGLAELLGLPERQLFRPRDGAR